MRAARRVRVQRVPHRLPGRGAHRGDVRDRHQRHRARHRRRRGDRSEDDHHHPPLLRADRGDDPRGAGQDRGHAARPRRGGLTRTEEPALPATGRSLGRREALVDETFEIEAAALAQVLDELDYFQILKIGQTAGPSEIKSAYYRESRAYHPDRFYQLPNADLKESIGRIYKRINEAYVCLRDDVKRPKYLADISGPERQKKLRFVEASEQEMKKEDRKSTRLNSSHDQISYAVFCLKKKKKIKKMR